MKHYLTKWFRSWGPLDELKTIAFRILHEGVDGRTPFIWSWFTGDHSTLCSNGFNRCIDLVIKGSLNTTSIKKLPQYCSNCNDTHVFSCDSKMSEGSPNVIFVDSMNCKLTKTKNNEVTHQVTDCNL